MNDSSQIDYERLYNTNTDYRTENSYTKIEKMIHKNAQSLLDVGCGSGHFLDYIRRKRPFMRVIGYDINKNRLTKALAKDHDVFFKDITACSLQKNEFDTITLIQVLEHFVDWNSILLKCYDAAAKEVILSVPYNEAPKDLIICQHCYKKTPRTYHLSFNFTKDTFRSLFSDTQLSFAFTYKRVISKLPFLLIKKHLLIKITKEDQDK